MRDSALRRPGVGGKGFPGVARTNSRRQPGTADAFRGSRGYSSGWVGTWFGAAGKGSHRGALVAHCRRRHAAVRLEHRPRVALLKWLDPPFPVVIRILSWSDWQEGSRGSARRGDRRERSTGRKSWPGSRRSCSSPSAVSASSGRCAICRHCNLSLAGRTYQRSDPIGCMSRTAHTTSAARSPGWWSWRNEPLA